MVPADEQKPTQDLGFCLEGRQPEGHEEKLVYFLFEIGNWFPMEVCSSDAREKILNVLLPYLQFFVDDFYFFQLLGMHP